MYFKNSSHFTGYIQVALAMRLVGSNNSLSLTMIPLSHKYKWLSY
ncbi:hypothetical protein XBP1_2070028 [Xenorhabdus bovienii str. puntauvense]|uniref:Uncharacterized protein n=3 Tax=Xenorhabdus bovienii TaxID=40576 RepID=A0A0B6X1N4_XENBV|nr:hypothetical protein XBFFR1_2180028 [Xenorhabdus bovienii str. feltiae France]CDG92711.1 hypothetical protein XBFFL1_2280039 [Xenorhabdus bovienii str. feltiae Florida]CDG96372.1 hypothetical protein XBP1_2070028 [Xenorhabdus bovienii str. puntauvense]CDH00457.1 hypothetical protein XBFM1_1660022 [Xenorhabdus bovienii str. feltiae Moldova]CDM87380.1 conserved protein of unknown function [Xenorhabdus bovienii]